jgi:HSP20 family protein
MAWLPWRRTRHPEETHPVARFRREMERAFEDFFRGGWLPGFWTGEPAWGPALDVRETDSDVIVDVEVPGLSPGDLDVSVTDGVLTVRGEKKSERDEKEGDYRVTERSHGSFSRTVTLPATVDPDGAKASHKDGVVTITLPKTEKSKAKRIEIK